MEDLGLIVERLCVNEVEFVIVGGLAVMMYGTGLVTDDVDVCVPFSADNLARIHRAVADLHPYHRLTPRKIPFVLKEGFEKGLRNLDIATDVGEVDFLGEVLGVGSYNEVYPQSIPVKMPYGEYRLLSIDKLITAKEALDRDKDRAAVRLLRSIRDSARPNAPPQNPS